MVGPSVPSNKSLPTRSADVNPRDSDGVGEIRRSERIVHHARRATTRPDRTQRGSPVELDLQALGHAASVVDRCVMRHTRVVMTDWLWVVGFVAVLGGMYFAAFRVDPHWVSKDGQPVHLSRPTRRPARQHAADLARVSLRGDRRQADLREAALDAGPAAMRAVARRGEVRDPPKQREVDLLASAESDNTDQMAIRLPASSRAVPVLEAMRLTRRDMTTRRPRSADFVPRNLASGSLT